MWVLGDCVTGSSGSEACETFYVDTVTKAVDVAHGHAFVTEYAGSTNDVLPPLFPDNPNLEPRYASTSLGEFVNALASRLDWSRRS